MKIKVYFTNEQDKLAAGFKLRGLVKKAIRGTLECEKFEHKHGITVSVTFTDNEKMQEKNREFRNIDSPTDVLSFPLYCISDGDLPDDGEICELGDIVISLERAAAQAEEYGHSYERECAFLTVHSMLHLLGYDHVNSDEQEAQMREHQRVIMKHIGLER